MPGYPHDSTRAIGGHMTTSGNRGPDSPTYGEHTGSTDILGEDGHSTTATAKNEGAHVADTAKDEAKQVADEAKAKAMDLLDQTKSQVDQQSRTQMQALAAKLDELCGELDEMVSNSTTHGTVTDIARQLSDRTRALSTRLADREPTDLLEDVRGFARQRPGTFLVGAAVAGVVAGRLTRGAKKVHDESTDTMSTSGSRTAMPNTNPPAAPSRSAVSDLGTGATSTSADQYVGGAR